MSGGSWDYACYAIDEAAGHMERWDHELSDLMRDLSGVCHDCEWADSADASRESGCAAVARFKTKWFHGDRAERLRGYVDERLASVREELMEMVGGDADDR